MKTRKQLDRELEAWPHGAGTKVLFWPGFRSGPAKQGTTTTGAQVLEVLEEHTAGVFIGGRGFVALTHVVLEVELETCDGCQEPRPNVGPWRDEDGTRRRLCGKCKLEVWAANGGAKRLADEVTEVIGGAQPGLTPFRAEVLRKIETSGARPKSRMSKPHQRSPDDPAWRQDQVEANLRWIIRDAGLDIASAAVRCWPDATASVAKHHLGRIIARGWPTPAAVEAICAGLDCTSAEIFADTRRDPPPRPLTITERIIQEFHSHHDTHFGASDFGHLTTTRSASGLLGRLVTAGELERVESGVYRLAQGAGDR